MIIKNKGNHLSIKDFKEGECFRTSIGFICMKVKFSNDYDQYNAVNLETGMMNYFDENNHTLERINIEGEIRRNKVTIQVTFKEGEIK